MMSERYSYEEIAKLIAHSLRNSAMTAQKLGKFLEDQFGRIVLQPVTGRYIDRLMGCLAEGPDLLANWEKEHREEK